MEIPGAKNKVVPRRGLIADFVCEGFKRSTANN